MGHSVGKAAENAVQRGAYKKEIERTPEQILKDIRRNLEARMAVTPDDVRVLLSKYDAVMRELESLKSGDVSSLLIEGESAIS